MKIETRKLRGALEHAVDDDQKPAMAKVVIMRGLPGVGKTSYIAERKQRNLDWEVSADRYPGLYNAQNKIDFSKLSDAHDWCFDQFMDVCETGRSQDGVVIYVDNTNTTLAEMSPYRMVARRFKLAVSFVTLAPTVTSTEQRIALMLEQRNTHNAPRHAIQVMMDRWEEIPRFWESETIVDVSL